ncbi:retention module-containing protein, partial [Campylobacter sp. RM16188]|uniref:retention module-containing protein n=1 Tax=Campylobacter sp. RM16188 TaxID=1705725 RepID=UPI00155561D3
MPNIVGVVKEISGSVVAKDELGVARTLNLGDEILLGESVETLDIKSKVVISMKDGEEVVLVGEDLLVLDQNFLSSQGISNVFASADEISDLQKAIIEGKDLNTLEATAAGGGSIAGGEGTSLSSENFTSSGNISNVFEGYGDLDNSYSDAQPFSSSSGNGNFASEAGVEEINSNSGNES